MRTNPTYRITLLSFTSVLTADMIYETILSPYNRTHFAYGSLDFDGAHTYVIALMLGVFISGIAVNANLFRLIFVIPCYAAIHETIWLIFYTMIYPPAFIGEFIATWIIWSIIIIIALFTHSIRFNMITMSLFTIFIAFNLIWLFGFNYINTLMMLPNLSHPYAFNIVANTFEWLYNIIFTVIFLVAYRWKK